jgi:hypothetical protein
MTYHITIGIPSQTPLAAQLQTPEPSPLRTPLLAPTPHPRRHPQTVLQLQNTLRALIRSHLPPSTRGLTGLSDDVQVTPYLHLHPQRLRFVLALGGLRVRPVHAGRARRQPLGAGRRAKLAYLLNNATKAPGLGLDVDALPEAVQAQHVLSSRSRTTPGRIFG